MSRPTPLTRILDSPWLVLLALVGLMAVRAYPELRIGATPIGSDSSTSYLVAFANYHEGLPTALTSFSLLYYLFEAAHRIGLDALLAIKATGVLSYGLLAGGFYLMVRNSFHLTSRFALFGTLLFAFQLGTLRLSWDLYRNELGLACAFLFIWQAVLWLRDRRPFRLLALAAFGILTLGFHQIVSLALVLLGVCGGLAWLADKRFGRPGALATIAMLAILWLLLAPHVTIGAFSLWNHAPITFTNENLLPLNLAALMFLPVLGVLALIGLATTWQPALLAFAFLMAEQSFASVFLRTQGFFLWDRWMYFLAIPVAIYAILGARALADRIAPAGISRATLLGAIFLLSCYPAYQFYQPRITLYPTSLDHHVFNIFPGTMMTNSFIANLGDRDAARNLGPCLKELSRQHASTYPVVMENRYQAIFAYYAPALDRYSTTAFPEKGPYYLITYQKPADRSVRLAPGTDADCPVYLGYQQ